jgi:heme/copper-type cytochrome/quinol oxidase subunit 3
MTSAPIEIPADSATAIERPMRPVLDVSELPSVVFGSRVITWWGTMGFMVAEAATLSACLAAYYYVLRNYAAWPPLRTPQPGLLIPTISLVVLVASLIPNYLFAKAAKRLDQAATRRWLWVATVMMLAATALRLLEFQALNVRWDANAYASVTWAIVVAHFTLVLADALETLVFAVVVSRPHVQERVYPGVAENAFYSYFMVAVWIPCFVTVYLVPRWV